MTIFVLFLYYLVGCLASYYRALGSFAHISKKKSIKEFLLSLDGCISFLVLFSWFGFLLGTVFFIVFNDRYFIKFSVKDHRE